MSSLRSAWRPSGRAPPKYLYYLFQYIPRFYFSIYKFIFYVRLKIHPLLLCPPCLGGEGHNKCVITVILCTVFLRISNCFDNDVER